MQKVEEEDSSQAKIRKIVISLTMLELTPLKML